MALAEPRTCNAYSNANVGSSTCKLPHPALLKSIATPVSALKLTGPAICNQCFTKTRKHENVPNNKSEMHITHHSGSVGLTQRCKEGFSMSFCHRIQSKHLSSFSFQTSPKSWKSSIKCEDPLLLITGSTRETIS